MAKETVGYWSAPNVILDDDQYEAIRDDLQHKINLAQIEYARQERGALPTQYADGTTSMNMIQLEQFMSRTNDLIESLSTNQDIPYKLARSMGKKLALMYREKYPVNRATKLEYTPYERFRAVLPMQISVFDELSPIGRSEFVDVDFETWGDNTGYRIRLGYVEQLNTIYVYRAS